MQRLPMHLMVLMVAAVLCLCAFAFPAGVPQMINYQGRLTDQLGNPLDGNYDLTFRLFDAATSGNIKWQETHGSVPVSEGIFSLMLGSLNPIDSLSFEGEYWLEIVVNGETLSNRHKIASVGYAYHALVSDSAKVAGSTLVNGWVDDGTSVHLVTQSDYVGIGTSTPNEPLVVGKDLGANNGDFIVVGNDTPDRWSGIMLGEDADNNVRMYWYNNTNGFALLTREAGTFQDGLILTGGKLGIGIDPPTHKLEIKAGGTGDGFRVSSSDGSQLFRVRESSSGFCETYLSDANGNTGVLFRAVGDSYLNAHNLGIGTTSPGYRLDVQSSGLADGMRIIASDGDDLLRIRENSAGAGDLRLYDPDENLMVLISGNEESYINSNNVGFGTTDPTARVDVRGDIYATGALKGDKGPNGGGPFTRPAYDSDWLLIGPGQDLTLSHNIGGSVNNYVIDLWWKGATGLIHPGSNEFAYWSAVTSSQIHIIRAFDDSVVNSVRVRIWVYE